MLNSFGGKFGMKDILSTMTVIRKDDFKKYDKKYNVSAFANINDESMLIKYSGRINETLRKFYKESELESNIDLKRMNRVRGTFSSVPIAAAMTAYARMSINDFKNIPNNPCIYSDTDSVILSKPLMGEVIGYEIGQMKLEHEIVKGIFIRTKLYAFYNLENKLIIKSSGISPRNLKWNDFLKLAKGQSVTLSRNTFNVNWKKLQIENVDSLITLNGINVQYESENISKNEVIEDNQLEIYDSEKIYTFPPQVNKENNINDISPSFLYPNVKENQEIGERPEQKGPNSEHTSAPVAVDTNNTAPLQNSSLPQGSQAPQGVDSPPKGIPPKDIPGEVTPQKKK